MEDEENVEPQAEQEVAVEEAPEAEAIEQLDTDESHDSGTKVPLSALQKERKKRQELEMELQWERGRNREQPPKPVEEDTSKYETPTREDLSKSQRETVRIVKEDLWIQQNPEKYEKVMSELENFLKQRPNYKSAINDASNRYEEAFTLMEKFEPRPQTVRKDPIPKRMAPGSPSSVPKASAINETIDVMSMTDAEFNAYRASKRRVRS